MTATSASLSAPLGHEIEVPAREAESGDGPAIVTSRSRLLGHSSKSEARQNPDADEADIGVVDTTTTLGSSRSWLT